MRDMYEVLDRWGAWAAADNSGVDWQPVAAGFKGLLPHGKKTFRLALREHDHNATRAGRNPSVLALR